jgi:uncharacterized protein YpmB
MQKIINLIALLSGLTSLAVIGSGVYLYKNVDVLVEEAREQATQAAVEAVSAALPALVEAATPDLPEFTGGVVPEPTFPR